jgi:hypothetical protein
MQPIRVSSPFRLPRSNPKFVCATCRAISKKPPRGTTFKTSAPPNRDLIDEGVLQRTIHPCATRPMRRTDIPIRMIVERQNHKRFLKPADVDRREMMKISRSGKNETSKAAPEFLVKSVNRALRSDESNRSPDPFRIDSLGKLNIGRQLRIPCVVQNQPNRVRRSGALVRYHSSPAFANF